MLQIAHRHSKRDHRLELDDLIQMGQIGLLKAIPKYDISKASFNTYAYYYIWAEIDRYAKMYPNLIHIPEHRIKDTKIHVENNVEELGALKIDERRPEKLENDASQQELVDFFEYDFRPIVP